MIRILLLCFIPLYTVTVAVNINTEKDYRKKVETSEDKVYALVDKYVAKNGTKFQESNVWYGILDMINNVYQKAGQITIQQMKKKYDKQIEKIRERKKNRKQKTYSLRRGNDKYYNELSHKLRRVYEIISTIANDSNKELDVKKNDGLKVLFKRKKRGVDETINGINDVPNSLGPFNEDVNKPEDSNNNQTFLETFDTPAEHVQKFHHMNGTRRKINSQTNFKYSNDLLYKLNNNNAALERKIQSLRGIKNLYCNENLYQIGYIMASIDTLHVNLENLNDNQDNVLNDKKLSALNDTIKKIHLIVNQLKEALAHYMSKNIAAKLDFVKHNNKFENKIKNYNAENLRENNDNFYNNQYSWNYNDKYRQLTDPRYYS